jgi:protein-tyrosine phosphatase
MIDLHTHILPNIDDGARDVATALQMTESLYTQNIMQAVCTPHFDPSETSIDNFVNRRSFALAKLLDARIQLIPASETILHEYLLHYSDLGELCIENTRYLLLELPYQRKMGPKDYENISRLIDYYNIIPIIAHVERYHTIKTRQMKILIRMGCILQLNAVALLNKKTRKKALRYIKKGYIDVIGSDCHDMQKRPPNMSEALKLIEKKLGAPYCERLKDQSKDIVNGIELRKKKSYLIE